MARQTIATLNEEVETLRSQICTLEAHYTEQFSVLLSELRQLQQSQQSEAFKSEELSPRLVLITDPIARYGWSHCGYIGGYVSRNGANGMAAYLTAHGLAADATVRKAQRTARSSADGGIFYEVKARGINPEFMAQLQQREADREAAAEAKAQDEAEREAAARQAVEDERRQREAAQLSQEYEDGLDAFYDAQYCE